MQSNRQNISIKSLELNDANPRTISKDKFADLVKSLIDFPEMWALRPVVAKPVVVEGSGEIRYVVLGGNMRTSAKRFIFELSDEEKQSRIEQALNSRQYDVLDLSDMNNEENRRPQVEAYSQALDNLFFNEYVEVEVASTLSTSQEIEFVIKDNTDFGKWDSDILANELDSYPLEAWGVEGIGKPREERVELAPDDSRTGEGDGSVSKVPNAIFIKFENPDDLSSAETAILEALTTAGFNGFNIKVIVGDSEY